jgi:hypothetical protein
MCSAYFPPIVPITGGFDMALNLLSRQAPIGEKSRVSAALRASHDDA